MANILYLVHRLPYPPNKGDKVRSFNLLKHLLKNHSVYLGTFIDDPDDAQHLPILRDMCADLHVAKLNARTAKIRSLNGLLAGDPLTLRYYRDAGLQTWIDQTLKLRAIDAIVIFCSAMAQYVDRRQRLPVLIDFVDVDSAKWSQYAEKHRWPLSWIYRREGRLLLNYERLIAARSTRSFFVTEAETSLFANQAPECQVKLEAMCNGVDAEFFAVDPARQTPFPAGKIPIVFTGAMDYWPNIDAVSWFAKETLPLLLKQNPAICFYIVGRAPTPEVQALANEHVVVTGTVADVRPYLQHAACVVAPLRVARGIQNKILEAMAMACAVITTRDCARVVDAEEGNELLAATTPEEFSNQVAQLLDDPAQVRRIGEKARTRVMERYSWEAHMGRIDRYLPTQART
ncbi:MAG: TIGR03087 family PEP-CTERM/XrtA system glycosyltransferase [Rhodocyclales bacterium GT-UBC]|nr:MAG: TIGR03087 family PEP-CTERM/XrtA system glycosyltransferase [Rhodocyclales bacterium GT-UBC]